ncbi:MULTISPECIES: sulfatase-like hydrolase/transferase [unclassified Roseovarius]|uniref:sulfatase-like hydrolase/transferase n=1 Tax=unclassified Roseovarius TaxID=2614913 RepID=UPI00273EF4B2|nr:sulfatase-like hydrolase/transferase [Roseovarius sp. MMSF_3350]
MIRALILIAAAGVMFCVLALPNHPGQMSYAGMAYWPIELSVLLFAMMALGGTRGVASGLALVIVAVTLLKLADLGSFTAYNRAFNPISDLFLVEAGFGLLSDSIGTASASLVVVGSILATVLVYMLLRGGLKAWGRLSLPGPARAAALVAALATGGWAVADTGHHLGYWTFEQSPPGSARTTRVAVARIGDARETVADLAQFRQTAEADPMRDIAGAFDRLEGRDILLIWVESYGRASIDNPEYAPTHVATLRRAEQEIAAAGLEIKSGWLTSPTAGGQSWLAHGAFGSGLWTPDNARYGAMIASGQKWLFQLAAEAGYRTAAVMPAITMAWPESAAMGFERVFEAKDIPYQGAPFNWVTMPDQFTLATYGDLLPDDPRPDFIQVALISSHAPWTPVPKMLPWGAIGDGTEFNEMAAKGPTPKELWKDRDAVRDAYRRSVDYSLNAVFSHVARLGEAAPLVIVAGDHQAAGFVAGSENRDVPVHMIASPDVLAMIDGWGWSEGMVPASDLEAWRMDGFRNEFIRAFSSIEQIAGVAR